MASFKLEKGGTAKEQARTAGAFLLIIGLIVSYLVWFEAGALMVLLGAIFFIASFAAKE